MNAPLKLTPAQVKQAANEAADPQAIVRDALARLPGDKGAIYEEEVIEALDAGVRSPEDIEQHLVASYIGSVPELLPQFFEGNHPFAGDLAEGVKSAGSLLRG